MADPGMEADVTAEIITLSSKLKTKAEELMGLEKDKGKSYFMVVF